LPTLAERLDAHCAALEACRRCGGDDPAALPVLAAARATRVMLVGQAPGKTETVDRRPFAGRAGRTLFGWLGRAGLDEATAREVIYIAAITRCYPGPSPSGRGDRVPSPRERSLCSSWLDDELRMIRPRLVIPVGRLAIDRFLGPAPLDQIVGRVHQVEHAGGRSLAIPLPHPSGASSWVHEHGHQALLERAIDAIRAELAALGVVRRESNSGDEAAGSAPPAAGSAGGPPEHQDRASSATRHHRDTAAATDGTPADTPGSRRVA
jgi:uracil-DNA glycosylase